MRHVESTALVDFAEIYSESVEMVSITASPWGDAVSAAIDTLLSEPGLQAQWVQGSSDAHRKPGNERREDIGDALNVLRHDIDLPVDLLKELLGCESCGVRIKVLEGPMCPRFHVDKVPCRMLMTYAGPGTEWIAHQDVDVDGFATGDPEPTRPGGRVRQLPSGVWSLLKGGNWDGSFGGVVHRSPSDIGRRLLVSLDPIFAG